MNIIIMKGGRLLGGYDDKPAKGGYFLGQTGGAIRRKRPRVKLRSTISQKGRVGNMRRRTLIPTVKQQKLQQQSSASSAFTPLSSKQHAVRSRGIRRRIQKHVKQRVRTPSRKAASIIRKSAPTKQVKETVQNMVAKKLNHLGKTIKKEAVHKLTDVSRKVGEKAVRAIAHRGKRMLEEDISEPSLPPVKRPRLNAAPTMSTKKGYLSGFKQYGGSRLF